MKWLCFLLFCNLATVFAQPVYYFTTKDSLYVGVKQGNKQIVPLKNHQITYFIDFKEPITSPVFELPGILLHTKNIYNGVAHPVNTIYNLQGKPLYYTLLFDNGSDYFQEDVRRIVSIDTGKVGFANEEGTILVQPEWDFAFPFNYGYAEVMNDVKKQYEDQEHWSVVPISEHSFFGYINKNGKIITPYNKRKHPKDYQISENTFLPYPFQYTDKEEQILSQFQKFYEVLNHLALSNLSTQATQEEASLQFEIILTPSKNFPYYKIQGYQFQRIDDSFTFLYDAPKQIFYHIEYPFTISKETIVPIHRFIIDRLDVLCKWYKENPRSKRQFEFNACDMLTSWQADQN